MSRRWWRAHRSPMACFNLGDVVVITRLVLGGLVFSVPAPPANQFNIGDSIGEGEAANGTIGRGASRERLVDRLCRRRRRECLQRTL